MPSMALRDFPMHTYPPHMPVFWRDFAHASRIDAGSSGSGGVHPGTCSPADDMEVPCPVIEASVESNFPELRALGLDDADLLQLAGQGYLDFDRRSAAGSAGCWRLRYRREGKLRTHYVGVDVQRLARVRAELAAVQQARRQQRRQGQMLRQAKQLLKRVKQQATPIALQVGFHFHGNLLRRIRKVR